MNLRPRFSLKMLLLLVAVVGMFCAYYANWIHQRHAILEKYSALEHYAADNAVFLASSETIGVPPRKLQSIPFMLRLFGERPHEFVMVVIQTDHDVGPDVPDVAPFKEQRNLAESLFPESVIYVHVYRWRNFGRDN
jgi:hypothetical protein